MLDYNTLKTIQRNERDSTSLTELKYDFHEEYGQYLRKLQNAPEWDIKLYRNTVNCYVDIMGLRLYKISGTVHYGILRDNHELMGEINIKRLLEMPPLNLHHSEVELYHGLLNVYKTFLEGI